MAVYDNQRSEVSTVDDWDELRSWWHQFKTTNSATSARAFVSWGEEWNLAYAQYLAPGGASPSRRTNSLGLKLRHILARAKKEYSTTDPSPKLAEMNPPSPKEVVEDLSSANSPKLYSQGIFAVRYQEGSKGSNAIVLAISAESKQLDERKEALTVEAEGELRALSVDPDAIKQLPIVVELRYPLVVPTVPPPPRCALHAT